MKNIKNHENTIILLMGIAGSGKRTVGEALRHLDNSFKLVHQHTAWVDPILNLLGDDSSVWWSLTADGWQKINEARDVILSTIADVCPKSSNFIITFEMWDKDPYHLEFYKKVLNVVKKRDALFVPVRLICDENNLVSRIQEKDRRHYFKTHDPELAKQRFKEKTVFYSNHKNELTLDISNISPENAAEEILKHIDLNVSH